jgi:hypothetical protein
MGRTRQGRDAAAQLSLFDRETKHQADEFGPTDLLSGLGIEFACKSAKNRYLKINGRPCLKRSAV